MTDVQHEDRPTGYRPPLTWGGQQEPDLTWPEPPPPAGAAAPTASGMTSDQPGQYGPAAPGGPVGPAQPPAGGRGGGWRNAAISALVAAVVSAGVAVPITLAVSDDDGDVAVDSAIDGEETPDSDARPTSSRSSGESMSVAEVAELVAPSVARVDVRGLQGEGTGSAVVYRSDGYLLTNAHVVSGAMDVSVTLPDGNTLDAEILGGDTRLDLAVLKVDVDEVPGGELPAAKIATEPPRVGETAIAIGSPFDLDGSVTAGIVSGLGRSIEGTELTDLIQTDAPINPGNSGGALVNDRAEVIGINTAILPGSPTSRGNIGIGFAIPITTATHLADQLIDEGFIRYAQLGVAGQDVDPRIAELYGLPVSEGALIVEVVPDSAADRAGLERGDIVTSFDGEEITSMAELAAAIRRRSPGEEVTLTVFSDGEEREIAVVLGSAEPEDGLGAQGGLGQDD